MMNKALASFHAQACIGHMPGASFGHMPGASFGHCSGQIHERTYALTKSLLSPSGNKSHLSDVREEAHENA